MVLNELVGKFPKIRSSLTGPFIKKYAHPELLSWISFILAIVSGYLFSRDMLLYASLAYLASGFFDILDGDMARKYGRASVFGDFLDHSFDRLSDLAGLVWIGLFTFVC